MPLELITGLPGNGKTAYLVSLFLDWEKQKLKRKIYCVGIEFLRELDLDIEFLEYSDVPKWQELEHGSLIIIDEAQEIFPQRMKGNAPDFITDLSTHRHHGLDFILVTQDPRLMDAWVRRLIAKHQHIKRLFGSNWQVVFTWTDKACDNPRDSKEQRSAINSLKRLPKQVYGVYKSATEHTIKSSVPKKVILSFFFILFFPVAGYLAFTNISMFQEEPSTPTQNKSSTTNSLKTMIAPSLSTPQPQPINKLIDHELIFYGYLKLNHKRGIEQIFIDLVTPNGNTKLTLQDLRSEPDLTFSLPSRNKLVLTQSGIVKTLYRAPYPTEPKNQPPKLSEFSFLPN